MFAFSPRLPHLVVSRLTGVCSHVKGKYGGPLGREIARGLYDGVEGVEGVDSGVVNQALMELGATYQSKVSGARAGALLWTRSFARRSNNNNSPFLDPRFEPARRGA